MYCMRVLHVAYVCDEYAFLFALARQTADVSWSTCRARRFWQGRIYNSQAAVCNLLVRKYASHRMTVGMSHDYTLLLK